MATAVLLLMLPFLQACGGGNARQSTRELPDEYYGVAGHVLFQLALAGSYERVDEHLKQIEKLDLAFVRTQLAWPDLEPEGPRDGSRSYDFAAHDRWVEALARHGLRWYVIGVGTPHWAAEPAASAAGCSIFSPPNDEADYAAMMSAVAGRYGRGGSFWEEHPRLPYRPIQDYEIWNEPNLGGGWCPEPDPARYARLVVAAEASLREIDPRARIVMGGLAPVESDKPAAGGIRAMHATNGFLEAATAAVPDLAAAVDVVGVHIYAATPEAMFSQLASYRQAVDLAGFADKPLSVNEIGWTTSGSGGFAPVSEEVRARYLAETTAAIARSDCDVSSFAPHTWVTEEADPTNQEQWFGIASPDGGGPYASGLAYRDEAATLPPGTGVPEGETSPLCGDT